jgi:hypothetical protein
MSLSLRIAVITAVGVDYRRIIDHYPMVINGSVTDISKTVFSDLLVTRDSGYPGPVIVKTNANYGGMREREHKFLSGDHTSNIDIQRPWRRVAWLDTYPVFDSLRKGGVRVKCQSGTLALDSDTVLCDYFTRCIIGDCQVPLITSLLGQ